MGGGCAAVKGQTRHQSGQGHRNLNSLHAAEGHPDSPRRLIDRQQFAALGHGRDELFSVEAPHVREAIAGPGKRQDSVPD